MAAPSYSGITRANDGRVKKILLLIVIAFISYSVYNKNVARKHEMLIGTWGFERNIHGIACKAMMDLKSDGTVSVEYDGSFQGRIVSKDAFGTWKSTSNAFMVTFTRGEVPQLIDGKQYGGQFINLEDKTLTYKSINGVETWHRLR